MQHLVVLSSAWPIVVLRCPALFDAAWVDELDGQFKRIFARKERFALITDTAAITALPGAKERRRLADWAADPEQVLRSKRYNVGSSTVVANPLARGGLQALYWFWTPASPQHAAKDFDTAWGWCLERLAAEHVELLRPERDLRETCEAERRHAADRAAG